VGVLVYCVGLGDPDAFFASVCLLLSLNSANKYAFIFISRKKSDPF